MIAAQRAGLAVLVTPSHYTDHESFEGAALVKPDLDATPCVTIADLERLLAIPVAARG